MNSAAFLEWIGDNAFVWLTVLGSVAVVVYLWSKFNQKERGR